MGAIEEPAAKKSWNAQLVELQNRNIYDAKVLQTLIDALSKPSFFIGFFSLQPVNVIFTLKSSLGFDENEASLGNQIADHWVSCDNTVIQLKQMTMENVKGGYYEVYLTIRSYLVRELLKQMFAFFYCSNLTRSRTILSSVDMLGNLQYFRSEKESNIPNLNYLEDSINSILSYSLSAQLPSSLPVYFANDIYNPLASRPSFSVPTIVPKKHSVSSKVGKAIGKTIDGVAHVSSKVVLPPFVHPQFTNGLASGLTTLIADDQFAMQRSIRMNRGNSKLFVRSFSFLEGSDFFQA